MFNKSLQNIGSEELQGAGSSIIYMAENNMS
jgi:hypothetical protein